MLCPFNTFIKVFPESAKSSTNKTCDPKFGVVFAQL